MGQFQPNAPSADDAGLTHMTHADGGYSQRGQNLADRAKHIFGILRASHPDMPMNSAPVGAEERAQYRILSDRTGK